MKDRLAVYLTLGLLIGAVYVLGRWDAAEASAWDAWRESAARQTGMIAHRYRARQDSLRALQGKAEARARELDRAVAARDSQIAGYEAEIARDSAASVDTPVAVVAQKLQLEPIADGRYATDSAGVRYLDSLRMEALKAPLLPLLRAQVHDLKTELTEVQRALLLAGERADSAEARVVVLEGVIKEGQRLATCRIAGLLPCPSRGVAFLAGLGLATAAHAALR